MSLLLATSLSYPATRSVLPFLMTCGMDVCTVVTSIEGVFFEFAVFHLSSIIT